MMAWCGPTRNVTEPLLSTGGTAARDERSGPAGRTLSQIAIGEINEYFEPFTGGPLDSPQQSWTVAVMLDWSAFHPR
jgi:hypothetical protein